MTGLADQNPSKRPWITVTSGRFSCESCGSTWVGSWHGPPEAMTCLVCKKPVKS